jgi:flagellar assembly protein FliH
MKWLETIKFSSALRDVRLLTHVPAQDWVTHLREHENSAYQKGRRDGERTASEQLAKQHGEMTQLQNGVLAALQKVQPQLIRDSESALINLALEAAQKIVAGMPVNAALVEAVVRDTLRQAEGSAEILIQLHPDDLALLRKHESTLMNDLPGIGQVRFTSSPEVTRGGCIAQTRFGMIDARRETKLEQLRKTLDA